MKPKPNVNQILPTQNPAELKNNLFQQLVLVSVISTTCSVLICSMLCVAALWFHAASLPKTNRPRDLRFSELPFDGSQWKLAKNERGNLEMRCRAKMLGDLVENHLRPGMTKESVKELLGGTDPGDIGEDLCFLHATSRWYYYLPVDGFEDYFAGLNFMSSGGLFFVIYFDKNGRYMGYKIAIS